MEEKVIKSYKGFDENLKCRDYQYEVGKEYKMDGEIKCCERGFHACESPLEVFDYYNMLNSRFCEVEQSGEIDRDSNTTKVCSSRIKIKAELKLADIINLGVEWIKKVTSPKDIKIVDVTNDNGGDSAQIGSSGDYAQIGSSGGYSVIMCAGIRSIARAKKGSWITLAEWEYDGFKAHYIPKCVKTEKVDGERIKEDTWYKLVDGEFKEMQP